MQLAAMSAAFPARLFRIAVPVWRWDHRKPVPTAHPGHPGLSREELQVLFRGDLWPDREAKMMTEREVEDHATARALRGALYPDQTGRH